jgi:hypothetical protein
MKFNMRIYNLGFPAKYLVIFIKLKKTKSTAALSCWPSDLRSFYLSVKKHNLNNSK